ncbi:MAG: alpha/beta fold hydrolase [Planctomycetota bacterium]|jgi:2-succinyl-6-hydroxy-2,4-cyclohexadiene-1-carboxylate synthase
MLVALHGFTETDQSWHDVFAGSPIATDCPLLPGHGWRPCPPETDLNTVASEIAKRLPEDGSGTLLGYSMGGRIALQTALDHPHSMRRLILVSSRAGLADDAIRTERQRRDERLAQILEEDGIGPFVAWWESHPVLKPVRSLSSTVVQQLRSRRLNQEPEGLAAALRALGQGAMTPLWSRLSEVSLPVLLVVGEKDPAFLGDMRTMADAMPNATLVEVPGTGHAIHREHPEALLEAVERFIGADA